MHTVFARALKIRSCSSDVSVAPAHTSLFALSPEIISCGWVLTPPLCSLASCLPLSFALICLRMHSRSGHQAAGKHRCSAATCVAGACCLLCFSEPWSFILPHTRRVHGHSRSGDRATSEHRCRAASCVAGACSFPVARGVGHGRH